MSTLEYDDEELVSEPITTPWRRYLEVCHALLDRDEDLESERTGKRVAETGREGWKALAIRQNATIQQIYREPEKATELVTYAMRDAFRAIRI